MIANHETGKVNRQLVADGEFDPAAFALPGAATNRASGMRTLANFISQSSMVVKRLRVCAADVNLPLEIHPFSSI